MEGAGFDILDRLRDVGSSDPFYQEALRLRIRLGDRTAVAELIRMTETAEFPHYWWHNAHRIWDESLRDALDSFLGRIPEDGRAGDWEWEGHHFYAARLLVEIPVADSEALILRHWEHLRYRSIFVQTALAVATSSCCTLVADAVSDCPDRRRLLEHFDLNCGLRTREGGQEFGLRQLKAILPYWDLFSGHTLESLWQYCNQQRWFDFRQCQLDPRLTEGQRRSCGLGREALFKELDRYLSRNPWLVNHELIERSQARGESWDDLLEGLLAWLHERRSLRALDVGAHALIWAGRRTDLARLREVEIDARPSEVERVLDSTAFQIFRRRLR